MRPPFFTHLRQQKRRICLVGMLAFLSGLLLYGHVGGELGAIPVPVAVGLIYGIAVVAAAAVSTYFLPNMRHLIDAVAVTRICLAFLVLLVPGIGQLLIASPLASATLIVGGASALLAAAPPLCRASRDAALPEPVRAAVAAAERGMRWLDHCDARSAERLEGTI